MKKIIIFLVLILLGFNVSCEQVFANKVENFANEAEWEVQELEADKDSVELNESVLLSANVTGDTAGLQYKFVWQKDNWKEWGVLRNFEALESVEWTPASVGKYCLIVDVKDEQGKVSTVKKDYTVKSPEWKYNSVSANDGNACKVATAFPVRANTEGNIKGLEYKFVWMKDNWNEWGMIQDYSESNTAMFKSDIPGKFTLIVDVKSLDGKIITKQTPCEIVTDLWEFDKVITTPESPQEKYADTITVKAETSGEIEHLQYKFVWMKDNWSKWGVLKNFSTQSEAEWFPDETGKYTLFVDVKDRDGRVETKTITYEIKPVYWEVEGITAPETEQSRGSVIPLEVNVCGNTIDLQYKFVWMKDNWKEWGVIRDYTYSPKTEWKTPEKSGVYTIFVDVKDRDNKVITQTTNCTLVSQIWNLDGVNVNDGNPEQIYRNIPVNALVSGQTEGLQYKYVWQKDNWSEWGVIRDYSAKQEGLWYPKKAGTYEIITNVKDGDGKIKIASQAYTVSEPDWKLEEILVESEGSYFVGDTVTVEAIASGETEGLQYKFVQRNGNDWSDWKVIRDFNENNTVEINIEKVGSCTIYVDIKDSTGAVIETKTKVIQGHDYHSVKASAENVLFGNKIKFSPVLSGNVKGMKCKYVWQKNNWEEWGVISEFSDTTTLEWQPENPGFYTIIIDVDLNGIVKSRSVTVGYMRYVRSADLYQIKDSITLPSGGYNVSTENIGLKVIEVNKKLLGTTNASYTSETVTAVKKFQKQKGLSQTGVVDIKTWLALGYSEDSWYNLGTYRTPIKTSADTYKSGYIDAMLETAKTYADAKTQYRIGCAGVPGTYADCSGLIYQCLYSVGINTDLNIVDHALAKYEYCSYYMAADSKLGPVVDRKNIQKGDLVFYCKFGGGSVCHIAIYAGDGMIYDAWPGIGVTKRSINISGYSVCKIRRVIV